MSGYSGSNVLDGQTNSGLNDLVISKWSSDGTRLWTQLLGGSDDDFGNGIAVDSEGSVFVTGYTENSVLDGQTNSGGGDIVISKWHTNGTRVWTRLYGGSFFDRGYGIAIDPDDNVIVTGYTGTIALDGGAKLQYTGTGHSSNRVINLTSS